jgi:hypothetical protein
VAVPSLAFPWLPPPNLWSFLFPATRKPSEPSFQSSFRQQQFCNPQGSFLNGRKNPYPCFPHPTAAHAPNARWPLKATLCLEAIHDREEKSRHHRDRVSIDVTLLSHHPAGSTVARRRAHGIHTCNQPTLSSNYRDLQQRRRIEEPETGADPSPSKINHRTCRKRDQHESISTTQGATAFLLRMVRQISNHKQVSRNNLLFPYRVLVVGMASWTPRGLEKRV